jgi:pilus assembly protein Flp/PilA
MLRLISLLYRDERGVAATEYALLIVFVALAVALGAQSLGTDIGGLFTTIGHNLSTASVPTP